MKLEMGLNSLNPGETGMVKQLNTVGSMRRRLLDIGLAPRTKVTCIGKSPAGDPAAYLIKGAVIAIRLEDGENIVIETGE